MSLLINSIKSVMIWAGEMPQPSKARLTITIYVMTEEVMS